MSGLVCVRLSCLLQATVFCLYLTEVFTEKYRNPKKIKALMEEHKIIPDLHTLFTFYEVEAKFKNGKEADMGNELTRADTEHPPNITYNYDDDAYYTLIMTDLDAPSPEIPNLREWQHWLVVNIPRDNLTAGDTLTEYIGPGTQNFTGKHRYVLSCYRQPGDRPLRFEEKHLDNKSDYGRIMFSTNTFVTDYDYGDPLAVNFWYTAHDHKRWY